MNIRIAGARARGEAAHRAAMVTGFPPPRGTAKIDGTMRRRLLLALPLVALAAAPVRAAETAPKFPDVVAVKVRAAGADTFDFDVTVSSPYDTPQRYADAFRVTGRDGTVYGERRLLHDHAGEQPFTRDLYGVKIPPAVHAVVVQARDRRYGYGGKTMQVLLPRR